MCGFTSAGSSLLRGKVAEAWVCSPLVTSLLILGFLFLIHQVVYITTGRQIVRWPSGNATFNRAALVIFLGAVAVNWWYVL